MTIKVVADEAIPFVSAYFSQIADVELLPGHAIGQASLRDADVLVCRTVTKVNEALLQDTNVRVVASPTSGIDHIDSSYLDSKEIQLCNAPGCNANSVAEYVLSSLFVLSQQEEISLADKCVGIIGCGHVGSRLRELLGALGISYRLCDPFLESNDVDKYEDLDAMVECDIISVHVPLTDDGPHPTRNLLGESFFSELDRDIILINTSRGGVVEESALKTFMAGHEASLLVVDVWENEPEVDIQLLQVANIATPHIAGYSLDGKFAATSKVFNDTSRHLRIEAAAQPSGDLMEQRRLLRLKHADGDNVLDTLSLGVLGSYDVRTDAAALRRMLEDSVANRGNYFMDLRNNYPPRREFSSADIELENHSHELVEKLLRLGFRVSEH